MRRPGADRRRHARCCSSRRAALPADRLHRRRRERAARRPLGARRSTTRSTTTSRPDRTVADLRRRRGAAPTPRAARDYAQRARATLAGVDAVAAAAAGRRRSGRSTSCPARPRAVRRSARISCATSARTDAPFAVRPAARRRAFVDQQASLGDAAPAARARIALLDDARDPVPDDRLGRAAAQGAADELARSARPSACSC